MTDEHKFIQLAVVSNKRMHYGFEIATNDYRNLPFFNRVQQNDNAKTGLKYQVLFEPRAITLDFKANLNYQFSDKFLLQNDFSYTQYNLIRQNSKPWGILPLEIKSALQWNPNNKWSVQASGQYWSGAYEYRELANPFSNKNALILNAGFTYKLSSNWSMWAKGDNLLDKPYERWADYSSLGVQLMGGVIYSFRK
jgi:outer membrane receptor for ferrienterochelin and colicin